jgi:hypothetical protein
MRFVAWLAAQGLAHSTIKGYLSGIRQLHLLRYGVEPDIGNMPLLQAVLKGVKRLQAATVHRPRLPITSAVLRSLRLAWERSAGAAPYDTRMLWAVACTCFFGFLRSGEATVPTLTGYDPGVHLSITDVAIDSREAPSMVSLRIKASKTDPFRAGVTIHLGRTDRDLCPVAALLSYIEVRGLQPGPLFIWRNGRPLTRQVLVIGIRDALSSVGINPAPHSGHSFRIGAATSAAAAGIEDAVIKILGRWSSSAYLAYVRIQRSDLSGVSSRMAA